MTPPATRPPGGEASRAPVVPISRRPLREDVRAALVRLLTGGELPPGSRIKEVELAERLGVSRTPLREALMSLEREGFIESRPSRGFTVLPLTVEEVRETYPIIWSLERLAIEQAADSSLDLRGLRALNRELARATDPDRIKELDSAFHGGLVAAAGNARLTQLLDSVKAVADRYEGAAFVMVYGRDEEMIRISRRQHTAIVAACARGDRAAAARLIEQHWRIGMEAIADWLESRE